MSSILSSQGVALATAMAVSAGTVIFLAFRLQKISPAHHRIPLRSCLSSEGKKKKKKKVHFAEDVVDPRGKRDESRRRPKIENREFDSKIPPSSLDYSTNFKKRVCGNRGMQENRAVLYNGILTDRTVHRRFSYYSGFL